MLTVGAVERYGRAGSGSVSPGRPLGLGGSLSGALADITQIC